MNCASCGIEIEPHSGPGRPGIYCGEACRRLAEFQIRALLRRLDKSELELRELKAGSGYYGDDDRRARMRAVRRWIKSDTVRLQALLGGNNRNQSKKGSKP